MYIYGGQLFWPAVTVILAQYGVLLLNYRRAVTVRSKYTERFAKLSGLEYNLFAGIQKLKLTGSENRAFTRWLDHYSETSRFLYNPAFRSRLYPALSALLGIGGTMFIFWSTLSNGVSTSDYIAFSSAFGMITAAIVQLQLLIPDLSQIKPLLESVSPILEEVPEMAEKAPQVEDLFGGIEVSGVSFRYQENGPLILDDLSLKIEPGEYVAIVGKSGCGKSTLMRLLLGFEQPLTGGIYYDNYDLAKVDKTSLRRKIGCCLQSGSLFTGDLFHNITITAPWATQKDAWEALRMANLDEDVRKMPMGLFTLVSEGGGGLSGGQKQRMQEMARVASPKIRLVLAAMVAMIVLVLFWCFFGTINYKVTAKGVVFPFGEAAPVSVPYEGTVSRCMVGHGEAVSYGTPVVEIRTLLSTSAITAPRDGVVISTLQPGTMFKAGEPVAWLLPQAQTMTGREMLCYVSYDGLRDLKVGQQVQVTPTNRQRERWGYAYGTVVGVEEYPTNRQEIVNRVKLDPLTSFIEDGQAVYEVRVILDEQDGKLVWSHFASRGKDGNRLAIVS